MQTKANIMGRKWSDFELTTAKTAINDNIKKSRWTYTSPNLIFNRSVNWLALSIATSARIVVSHIADHIYRFDKCFRRKEIQHTNDLEQQIIERTATLSFQIAERRQAEANFLQATAILRGIGQNSPDPIYAKDTKGRFVYANPATLAVIGKRAELVLGFTDAEWHSNPDQAAAVLANDQQVMKCRLPKVVEETFDTTRFGKRTFRSAKAPLILDDGTMAGIVCVSSDITDRKNVEDELRVAKAEAEKASQAKSKFLAAASHDLRQPVQSLTLLLSMIKNQVADKPKAAQGVIMAETALKSLNGLLTGILDISKLEAGVVEPFIESVDLGQMIDKLSSEYRSRAMAANLRLRLVPCSLLVRADRDMVERILRNLLENALRYTPSGSILIGVRRHGENARLDVIDTGIGIAADKLTDIFEDFRQLNNPARDSSQGLGIGLAIVSRLAGLLEAKVEVVSNPNRGSRFSLVLPIENTEPAAIETRQELDDGDGRILIIEDNPHLRYTYEMMLTDWGYEPFSAATGEEAIDLAAKNQWRFDIIVADHRLGPGLTGAEAAAEIARRAGHEFPTMIVTGDTAKERIAEIHASGFIMLHKPVEAADLRQCLAEILQKNREFTSSIIL